MTDGYLIQTSKKFLCLAVVCFLTSISQNSFAQAEPTAAKTMRAENAVRDLDENELLLEKLNERLNWLNDNNLELQNRMQDTRLRMADKVKLFERAKTKLLTLSSLIESSSQLDLEQILDQFEHLKLIKSELHQFKVDLDELAAKQERKVASRTQEQANYAQYLQTHGQTLALDNKTKSNRDKASDELQGKIRELTQNLSHLIADQLQDREKFSQELNAFIGDIKPILVDIEEAEPKFRKAIENAKIKLITKQDTNKLSLENLRLSWDEFSTLARKSPGWLRSLPEQIRMGLATLNEQQLKTNGLFAVILSLLLIGGRVRRKLFTRYPESDDVYAGKNFTQKFTLGSIHFFAHESKLIVVLAGIVLIRWTLAAEIPILGVLTYLIGLSLFGKVLANIVNLFLSPKNSIRRLIELEDELALHLVRHLNWLIAVISMGVFVYVVGLKLELGTHLFQSLKFVAFIIGFLFLISILRTSWLKKIAAGFDSPNSWRIFAFTKFMILALVLALIVIEALGYSALSDFIIGSLLKTATFWLIVAGLWRILEDVFDKLFWQKDVQQSRQRALAINECLRFIRQAAKLMLLTGTILGTARLWTISREVLAGFIRLVSYEFLFFGRTLSVLTLIAIVMVFWLFGFLTRILTPYLRGSYFARRAYNIGTQNFITTVLQALLWTVAGIIILQILGFDLTNLTVITSALTVGLGLALQSNVTNNFISSIILHTEVPLKPGDFVEIEGMWGTIQKVGARATEIQTIDNSSILVPNTLLVTREVKNWTHNNPCARVSVEVGVTYGSDAKQAHDLLLEIGRAHPQIETSHAPEVLFAAFGDSALIFKLNVWVKDAKNIFQIKSDLHFAIYEKFAQHGLAIAYPQRDLHIVSAPGLKEFFTHDKK